MRLSRFTNAYFGATRPRNARLRPRGQVIPEVVIEAPGISPARKPRINLRPTGDGEACEDPRSRRIWRLKSLRSVRRQSFWDRERLKIRESLARLVFNVMRPADGAASGDWRLSFV